ncbi:hypothetical protein [Thermoflexus sp.]|uniref:hypothetical protein n=1 Tax=Thermoflexus sp. TaxID=1969742 RepID=UPI002ADDA610|nr:hypothetical protein [Thermoflexus sp.]
MRRLPGRGWRRDQRGQGLVSFALAMVPFFLILLYLLYSGAYAMFWGVRTRQMAEQAIRASSYAGPALTGWERVGVSQTLRSLDASTRIVRDTGGRPYGTPIRWGIHLRLFFRRWGFWGGPPLDWW